MISAAPTPRVLAQAGASLRTEAEAEARGNWSRVLCALGRTRDAISEQQRAVELRRSQLARASDEHEAVEARRCLANALSNLGAISEHLADASGPADGHAGETPSGEEAWAEALTHADSAAHAVGPSAHVAVLTNLVNKRAFATLADAPANAPNGAPASAHLSRLRALLAERGRDIATTCAICLEDLGHGDGKEGPVCVLHCAHGFHARCIERWQEQGGEACPLCNQRIHVP